MRTHFKERSKRNRIDLTNIGREEIIAPAIARMREQDHAFLKEDELRANLPPPPPIPRYVREEVRWGEIIINALNPTRYLP